MRELAWMRVTDVELKAMCSPHEDGQGLWINPVGYFPIVMEVNLSLPEWRR